MDTQTRNLLLQFDEVGRYETPSKFKYGQLRERVVKLAKELEARFEKTFPVDDQVQDASFSFDVGIPQELVTKAVSNVNYSIRISNFGSLATINFEEEYPALVVATLKETLAQLTFIFVSAADLDTAYDGRFAKFKELVDLGAPTWYTRYFDYL